VKIGERLWNGDRFLGEIERRVAVGAGHQVTRF
jgi:hypothetical protein